MSSSDRALNPLLRDGISRNSRQVAALDPTAAPVDERELADLLLYAREYARRLRFHPLDSGAPSDWFPFIDDDVTTLVALIGTHEHDAWRDSVLAPLTGGAATLDALAEAIRSVLAVADEIDDWFRRSPQGLLVHIRLERFIRGSLAEAVAEAWSSGMRLESLTGTTVVPARYPGPPWSQGGGPPPADPTFLPTSDAADRREATRRVVAIVERVHAVLTTLRTEAPDYLAETLEAHPAHRPHLALYLAYLQLLGHTRDRLNDLTAEHLDFYYRDVLQLDRRPAQPDRAHVVFELRGSDSHRITAGTGLKAGDDSGGNPVTFLTDSDLVVNGAAVDELKTVFLDVDGSGIVSNVHAAAVADSADGSGAEILDEDGGWRTFGDTTMPYGTIGFAVAAPSLYLAQGTRTITVALHTRHTGDDLTAAERVVAETELRDNVTVRASGEEAWLTATTQKVVVDDTAAGRRTITFTLQFGRDARPIVGYDDEVLGDGYDASDPVLKFVVDSDGLAAEGGIRLADRSSMQPFRDATSTHYRGEIVSHDGRAYRALSTYEGVGYRPPNHPNIWHHLRPAYAYRHLRGLVLDEVAISVTVEGMTDLVLENDLGPLDPAKPFQPFGAVPRVGSSFLVGSGEAFSKRLMKLVLHVTWGGLPADGFAQHYDGYVGLPAQLDDDHFTADLQVLTDGEWVAIENGAAVSLFEPLEDSSDRRITVWDNQIASLTTGLDDVRGLERFGPAVPTGFVRARLGEDFFHSRYPASLAAHALRLASEAAGSADGSELSVSYYGSRLGGGDTSGSANSADDTADLPPNPAYTPQIEGFSVDYAAEETVDLTRPARTGAATARTGGQVFQIWPFGTRELRRASNDPLLPEFETTLRYPDGSTATTIATGTLYVGLTGLDPTERPVLSLLVQIVEGSADPTVPAPTPSWAYLADDEWVDFTAAEILSDGTNGLTTSGIVQFSIPATMTSDNSVLPSGRHWIKVSVDRDAAATVKAVALYTQAVTATFSPAGNVPDRVATAIPAGAIDKLVNRQAEVKKVTNPEASSGGRAAESASDSRVRVSELLRHRHRAVTIVDYERIVLEQFPEIHKVRCINHTDDCSEYAPGKVRLVVVPDQRQRSAVDPLRPRVSVGTLERIERYVRDLASDFAVIEVTNPDYEEIRARFRVRFRPGYDIGYYTRQLNDDIIELLSPWRYDDAPELTFGGRIHRSWLLAEIEDFEYVDFVADFQIDHVRDPAAGTTDVDVEEARATRSSTVLVSAPNHQITHDLVSCSDETVGGAATAPPPPPAPLFEQPGPRYLGNSSERELHDRWNLTTSCQIDEIAADRRYYFATPRDAAPLGYDPCAYCIGGRSNVLLTTAPDNLAAIPPTASEGTPPSPSLDPAPDLRYLGNATSRELHDRWNLTAACQEDEIAVDRRYYFSTSDEAQAVGYDVCAHCFGRERSQR